MKTIKKSAKLYPLPEEELSIVSELAGGYLKVKGKSFHEFIHSDMDILNSIREGVTKNTMDATLSLTGISLDEMSSILHVSARTLRRYTAKSKLNSAQSERIFELIKLYHYGEEVLGDLTSFRSWMDSTIEALGQKKPKEFLDTSIGIKWLMNILGRIEHGVYS